MNFEKLKKVGKSFNSGSLNILAIGGSLGANEINHLLFNLVQHDFKFRLNVQLQTGLGNYVNWKNKVSNLELEKNNIEAVAFIENMPLEYERADIIISRSGASSLSELEIIGKPCFLIPYPHASDNHQYKNAQVFAGLVKMPVVTIRSKDAHNIKNWITQMERVYTLLEENDGIRAQNDLINPLDLIYKEII